MLTALILASTTNYLNAFNAFPIWLHPPSLRQEVSENILVLEGSSSRIRTTGLSLSQSESKTSYHIEEVNTKRRALDVRVFRGLSESPADYISNQFNEEGKNIISEDEAVDLLMPHYDENGRYTKMQPNQDQEVFFAAIYNPDNSDTNADFRLFEDTNGVIGVVSAQLRQQSPFIVGSSVNSTDHTNPAVQIPSPHLYLANMRVHEKLRRRGIGVKLLSAVVEYANKLNEKYQGNLPIVLSVDNDNTAAIKMYENFGFEYMEKNDVFRMMIFRV